MSSFSTYTDKKKISVFSDSFFVLSSIKSRKLENSVNFSIKTILLNSKHEFFFKISSHIRNKGNNKTQETSEIPLKLDLIDIKIHEYI